MTLLKCLNLNSGSPRRRELLDQIAVPYEVVSAEIDETPFAGEHAQDYVLRLAEAKARAGYELLADAPCLGSDTSVVFTATADGTELIMGKPKDQQDAERMLSLLSGTWHSVFSSVCIFDGTKAYCRVSESRVRMRKLSKAEILRYWHSKEPLGKAGAYAIQGLGAMFIEELKGSYSGVMGLPLAETAELLDLMALKHGLTA
ncbi:nucleoside triphosphate pyrophosphatase [Agaribacterium sp. ZY112]|uniref:Maf family protein n=1 Tax=Agaribacterium sp. ZY112 TaxID=3233574 RepID=UPI0035257B3E